MRCGGGSWLCDAGERHGRRPPAAALGRRSRRFGDVGSTARRRATRGLAARCWMRCICGRFGQLRDIRRSGPQRRFWSGPRRRGGARLDPVCPWCARGGLVPHFRRSRLTKQISGGDRRGQGQSVRTSPRASREAAPLDGGGRRSCAVRSAGPRRGTGAGSASVAAAIDHGRARAECLGRSWRSGAGTRRGHEGLAWPRSDV